MPVVLRQSALALLFLLELCMLAAYAYWGFHTGGSLAARVALCVGVPLAVAVIWGIFMAPRAVVRLPAALHLILFVILFGAAALALGLAGQTTLAVIFAVAAAVSKALTYRTLA
ncbi:MAG TPA: YrdB family protein [Ktedonobacterales bacterium]|nr:YrdB family protein [Ktedonobacterales bacterium]